MNAIGLDIGTTTICAIVVDIETGIVKKTITDKNDTVINGASFERLQDPNRILEKVTAIAEKLCAEFSPISCIGITGQMHGIVYLDKQGNTVSPLYIWQDESGNELYCDGKTYAEYLSDLTGYPMATGFGLTTVFYHSKNGFIPTDAVTFCTIHDFVAMKLANRTSPVIHASDAASFGLYDLAIDRFDQNAIEKAGVPLSILPKVGKDNQIQGYYNGFVPVALAIGDNQASYLGSVCNLEDCLLVNVGTGSQISFVQPSNSPLPAGMELRPCMSEKSLAVGSSLCGGRAFAVLEQFFRQVTEMATGEVCESAYPGMDRLLESLTNFDTELSVSTQFCGTRAKPEERGFIQRLGLQNFTPQDMMLGVLHGIVDELYEMYEKTNDRTKSGCKTLIGSGNGLRQTPVLQRIFEKKFGLSLHIPAHKEEAAYGAVLFALVASGCFASMEDAQKLIKYL